MPGCKLVLRPSTTVYAYDGGLMGFYCCVHESVYSKEMPQSIVPLDVAQPSLFKMKQINTDIKKALDVRNSIISRVSREALELLETVFMSCLEKKEMHLLRFLILAYEMGRQTVNMLSHPAVHPVLKAEKHLMGEAHLLKGFVRFTDYDGMLGAVITPKNFILPFIAEHFVQRYSCENFLIHDKTHKHALIYENGRTQIVPLEDIAFNEPSEAEQKTIALWKQFYKTVAIEARYNPKCRMNLMPKRYWANMTEMKELL